MAKIIWPLHNQWPDLTS